MINELEFIHKILPYLDGVKERDGKFQFRCNCCGDGKTSYKARAWFLERDSYYFHCFNCSAQMSLPKYLELKFPEVYKEYVFEKLKSYGSSRESEKLFVEKKKPIDYTAHNYVKSLLKPFTDSEDAVKYIHNRQIPSSVYKDIYIIENFQDLSEVEKYNKTVFTKETRIVLPVYNKDGLINGIISRAIDENSKKRYIILKFQDDHNIYGLYDSNGEYKINLNKPIFVLEGAFDSMFVDNAVSVNTSDLLSFNKAISDKLLDRLNVIYVPDNDTRNKEIIAVYKKIIDAGKNIVILPKHISGKDINEIILGNKDINIMSLLKENTFNGIIATVKMNMWKKIT